MLPPARGGQEPVDELLVGVGTRVVDERLDLGRRGGEARQVEAHATGERPAGFAVVLELLRGYILAPLISGLLLFLTGVGLARKIRSLRHGWSETHVPIVVKLGGYEQLVDDLQHALASADIKLAAKDAAWVLTLPARVLTTFAGENVRKLRPDRLIELTGRGMRIGVYPSDIAISGKARDRTRARAAK